MLEEMVCSICKGIFRDPIIDSCGHIFGKKCFMNFIKDNSKCPISNLGVSKDISLMSCNPIHNFLSKLQVRCTYNDCGWTGMLDTLDKHTSSDCDFELMKCPNSECNYKVVRKDYDSAHDSRCNYRIEMCLHCKETLQFNQFEKHLSVCSEIMIRCPQECSKDLKRGEIIKHLENDCEERIVFCDMKKIGCSFTGKMKEVEEHQTSTSVYSGHLNLIIGNISQTRSSESDIVSLVYEKLVSMERKIDDLSQSINIQKTEIQFQNEKVEEIKIEMNKRSTENLIAINEIKETMKTLKLPKSEETKDEIDLKCSEVSLVLEKQFNTSLDNIKKNFDTKMLDLKNNICQIDPASNSNSFEVYFDQSCKSSKISLRNTNEVVYKANFILDFFVLGVGSFALLNAPIIPDRRYKIVVLRQLNSKMAFGICSKEYLSNYDFQVELKYFTNSYLFCADGDYLDTSKSHVRNAGRNASFKTNDILELVFESRSRKLICRNLTSKTITEINIKNTEDISQMFPCVRLIEKNESSKII